MEFHCWLGAIESAAILFNQPKAEIQLQPLGLPSAQPRGRFFNRVEQMRGRATRYDRRAVFYMAAFKLAATRIWVASANESAS
ncbi:hypothetical protein D3C73_1138090 [compost metagenome]